MTAEDQWREILGDLHDERFAGWVRAAAAYAASRGSESFTVWEAVGSMPSGVYRGQTVFYNTRYALGRLASRGYLTEGLEPRGRRLIFQWTGRPWLEEGT